MRAVDLIRRKRDGESLSADQIDAFVQGATRGDWPDYQVSALLMAIVCRGMTQTETADLTAAMVRSGKKLDLSDLPGLKVDKHSTGGVGDKTSLILAPLAAACGVIVPMMSGRGLGHTGGTLDKLESIPGFRVRLTEKELRAALKKVGCAMIGQTRQIAPADRVLYSLRDVTATVESIPLISASIMSKKIAEGIGALVLDVKFGRGAFMQTLPDARRLAESLVAIGTAHNVRTEAVITAMDEPLGQTVGNALEVDECISVLRNTSASKDLIDLSVHLAARMVRLAGLASTLDQAEQRIREVLASGEGLKKFRQIIKQQGGDPTVTTYSARLPCSRFQEVVRAPASGYITAIDAREIGRAAMLLGAGRFTMKDRIDPAAGAVLLTRTGEKVKTGDAMVELHCSRKTNLPIAMSLAEEAFTIGEEAPVPRKLLLVTPEQASHVH
jgi:pyrimidine-nucleoside phosphorylase